MLKNRAMENPSGDEAGLPCGGLRDYVLGVLPKLGLSVTTVEVDGEDRVSVTARSENKILRNTVLVEAVHHRRKVGSHALMKLRERMEGGNVQEGVFISTSGFTDEAVSYSTENHITLFTPHDLEEMTPIGKAAAAYEHKIYERVFAESVGEDKAKEFFGRRMGRRFFGLGGFSERVDAVEGRYAPVGCFALRKRPGLASGAEAAKAADGGNSFHVNLTTCELYYVYMGVAGRGARIKSTNIFRRMMDLPEGLVRLLAGIFEREELLFDRMSEEQRMLMQENMNSLVMLENLGLAGLRRDGRGYVSNVILPPFNDARYDLTRFIEVRESVESRYGADEMAYQPNSILELLKDFYNAEGEFRGVTYMPYFRCRYVNSDGGVRFDAVDSIGFKNG